MNLPHRALVLSGLVALVGCGGGDNPAVDAPSEPDTDIVALEADVETGDVSVVPDATDAGQEPLDEVVAPDAVDDVLVAVLDAQGVDTTTGEVTDDAVTDDAVTDGEVTDGEGAALDAAPETVGPFVCEDDGACSGQIEVPACTKPVCVDGRCVPGPDEAAEGTGCDDGDPCTTGAVCQGGVCTAGEPVDCDDVAEPPCLIGVCDLEVGGCVAVNGEDGAPCDDADLCTEDDVCLAGACVGQPLCDDGDACNGPEACDGLGACSPGTPLVCQSADPCLGVAACDTIFGCVLGPPPDCGAYLCAEGSCPSTCESHDQCVPGTFCDNNSCVPTLDNGAECSANAMCLSDHCGGVCCAAGQCCTTDAECPLADVSVVASQESVAEQSGFARVIITPSTFGLQTFVPNTTSVLERVDIMLQTPLQEGYLLEVVLWDGAPPAEEVAKTTLIVVASSSEPMVWTATFEEPTTLEPGQSYGLSLSWLNGDPNCTDPCAVIWLGEEADPYPQGTVYRTYDGGGEWESTEWNDDLWFRIWAGQHSCEDFSCAAPAP
ncbi:MAG: hypothetical protein QF464_00105 [Myxococcota bacterium]|nr:hypothetical protein [Myxococcota bacterium]